MPIAISLALRQSLIEQHLAGKSLLELSKQEQLSYPTVWSLYQRYKKYGWEGLKPRYENCGPQGPKYSAFIFRAVRCLKTWHPKWGAGRIRVNILQKYTDLDLPSERTLQLWFRQNGQNKPKSKQPEEEKSWAKQVHEVWQVDAKEEVRLANNKKVCWLTIEDEKSSGILDPIVFPLQKDLPGPYPTGATKPDTSFF